MLKRENKDFCKGSESVIVLKFDAIDVNWAGALTQNRSLLRIKYQFWDIAANKTANQNPRLV